MIELQPMTDSEFDAYKKNDVYADEMAEAYGITVDKAMKSADEQFKKLLPKGLNTPNHFLYSAIETESKKNIGCFWFALNEENNIKSTFAYDIFVRESERKRGYGYAIMKLFEQKTKENEAEFTEVHVFHHNKSSVNLCKKLGYKITQSGKKSMMMKKDIY